MPAELKKFPCFSLVACLAALAPRFNLIRLITPGQGYGYTLVRIFDHGYSIPWQACRKNLVSLAIAETATT